MTARDAAGGLHVAVADGRGNARLGDLPRGTHLVTADAPGHLADLPRVISVGGRQRRLSVALRPVESLPVVASVRWSVSELPFAGPGPGAGISGTGSGTLGSSFLIVTGFLPAGDGSSEPGSRTSRQAFGFSPISRRWSELPRLPERREYATALFARGSPYLVGGARQHPDVSDPEYPYRTHGDCFTLRPHARAWRGCGRLSEPRSGMSGGTVGRFLVAAGGTRYLGEEEDVELSVGLRAQTDVLDLDREAAGWRRGAPMPAPMRVYSAAAGDGRRLLVVGGLRGQGNPERRRFPLREILAYRPDRDRWRRLGRTPISLSGAAARLWRGRWLLVAGGVQLGYDGADLAFNDEVFAYDIRTGRWGRLRQGQPRLPQRLNGLAFGVARDRVFVAGGEGPGSSHWNELYSGRLRPSG